MNVPLTTADFLYHTRTVHSRRLGAVDELTRLGVGPGGCIAIISPNAVKLLIAL
jgi:hypothetical protein